LARSSGAAEERIMHGNHFVGRQERPQSGPSFRRSMKSKFLALAAAPIAAALWAAPSLGQTLSWDASGATPLAPTDGSGNWNTTTDALWSNGAGDSTWVSGNIAAIGNGGTAGTVTINDVSGTVNAAGINFNPVTGSYT